MMLMAAAVTAAPAMAAVYTDSASFLADVQPGFYFNNFTGVPQGDQGSLNFSGNGFAYTISAVGPGSNRLFNGPGIISTDFATDAIQITFTSGNVTAVGGNMWATDVNFNAITANMVVSLSDGTTVNFTASNANAFRGFTSTQTITSLTIDALDTGTNAWSTLDNLYVGAAVPAPNAMALLGLGGLAAARRRR